MNRRDFLKFLGGTAAAVAVAPQALAEALDVQQAYPVIWHSPDFSPVKTQSHGFIVLEPGMSVQEAINALPKEGGTVYLPSGTYITNQEIVMPEGVQMVGEGDMTIAYCTIKAEPRPRNDAPIVFLMEEDDQVKIIGNTFTGDLRRWFEVPIEEHLAELSGKMRRLFLKAKQLII